MVIGITAGKLTLVFTLLLNPLPVPICLHFSNAAMKKHCCASFYDANNTSLAEMYSYGRSIFIGPTDQLRCCLAVSLRSGRSAAAGPYLW